MIQDPKVHTEISVADQIIISWLDLLSEARRLGIYYFYSSFITLSSYQAYWLSLGPLYGAVFGKMLACLGVCLVHVPMDRLDLHRQSNIMSQLCNPISLPVGLRSVMGRRDWEQ